MVLKNLRKKNDKSPFSACISSIRLWNEPSCTLFGPFTVDLERITQSSYFRRLQGKTQVWGVQESDFFRTRLTHSLETAHIGTQVAKHLGIDQDLVNALCLAHDLGHPPFGHEGARLLDYFAKVHSAGRVRFDDNAQNLRILCKLATAPIEQVYGLNLCASMVDGLIKYKRACSGSCGWYPEEDDIVAWAARECSTGDLRNPLASIVEVSDDLAYVCHDLEDAIRADMIRIDNIERALDSLTNEKAKQLVVSALAGVLEQVKTSDNPDALRNQRHKIRQSLLSSMLSDVIKLSACESFQTRFFDPRNHETLNPYLTELPHIAELLEVLKEIVLERVINTPNVQTLRFASLSLMQSYLERFWPLLNEPNHPMYQHALLSLPRDWQWRLCSAQTSDERLRFLLDYVSGMSDQYFMNQAGMFYNPISYRAVENRK